MVILVVGELLKYGVGYLFRMVTYNRKSLSNTNNCVSRKLGLSDFKIVGEFEQNKDKIVKC